LEKYKDVAALPNFKFPVSTLAFNSIIHAFAWFPCSSVGTSTVCIPTLERGNEKAGSVKSVNYFWTLMRDAKFFQFFPKIMAYAEYSVPTFPLDNISRLCYLPPAYVYYTHLLIAGVLLIKSFPVMG